MGWTIPATEQQTYSRNALATVVAQLRFHPVLKMPGFKNDFQDLVRRDFPVFEEKVVRSIAFNIGTSETVLNEEGRLFLFTGKR